MIVRTHLTAAAAGLAAAVGAFAAAASATTAEAPRAEGTSHRSPVAALRCVGPDDAAGLDSVLASAGSPLAGLGATFVDEGHGHGIDPRFLVAVAAHETLLETYGPARRIRNPFGIGPHWTFASERAAIAAAARIIGDYYLTEGRTTVATIGAKWAPIGASNDPGGLNNHWERGVGTYYTALGADAQRPVTLAAQDDKPACEGPAPGGTPVVTAWNGATPGVASPAIFHGADPATGLPATIAGFVFPLAAPRGAPVRFADSFTEPGAPGCFGQAWQCATTLESTTANWVVSAAAGTLRAATPDERAAGVGFWVEIGPGERLAYGPLLSYLDDIDDGVAVAAGRPLGRAPTRLLFAWERDGHRVNPYPLLSATRPSA